MRETEIYEGTFHGEADGLSRTCRYRDNSMRRLCYYHESIKGTYIETCEGCYEDGRNTERKKLN